MEQPPGRRLLAFAARWFEPATVARVFEPLVADWQREWAEAPPLGRAWVSVRGGAAFACAVAVSAPDTLRTSVPATVTRSIVIRVLLFTEFFSLMLALPMLLALDRIETSMLMIALPAAVVLALPFGVGAGVDAIRRDRAVPAHVQRAAALKLAAAACGVMLILLGWVLPAASQQWRAATAAAEAPPPERGLREFTIVELATDPWMWSDTRGPNVRGREVRREITHRVSLSLLPMLIVWIRWRMIDIPPRRYAPLPISVMAAMMLAGFMLLLGSGDLFEHVLLLPRVSASWGPWAALGIIGLIQAFRDMMPSRGETS